MSEHSLNILSDIRVNVQDNPQLNYDITDLLFWDIDGFGDVQFDYTGHIYLQEFFSQLNLYFPVSWTMIYYYILCIVAIIAATFFNIRFLPSYPNLTNEDRIEYLGRLTNLVAISSLFSIFLFRQPNHSNIRVLRG